MTSQKLPVPACHRWHKVPTSATQRHHYFRSRSVSGFFRVSPAQNLNVAWHYESNFIMKRSVTRYKHTFNVGFHITELHIKKNYSFEIYMNTLQFVKMTFQKDYCELASNIRMKWSYIYNFIINLKILSSVIALWIHIKSIHSVTNSLNIKFTRMVLYLTVMEHYKMQVNARDVIL